MFKWPIRIGASCLGLLGGLYYGHTKTKPVFDHIFEDSDRPGYLRFKKNINNTSLSFVNEYSKYFNIKESIIPKGLLSDP